MKERKMNVGHVFVLIIFAGIDELHMVNKRTHCGTALSLTATEERQSEDLHQAQHLDTSTEGNQNGTDRTIY